MSPSAFLQKPAALAAGDLALPRHDERRPELRLRPVRARIAREQLEALDLSSWTLAFNGAEPVRAEHDGALRREVRARAASAARPSIPATGWPRRRCFVDRRPARRALVERCVDADGAGARPGAAGRRRRVRTRAVARRLRHAPGAARAPHRRSRDARAAPPSERVGEIWIAGAQRRRGYWNGPRRRRRPSGAPRRAARGPFLRTGDLGFLRGGELFVTGRLKDLVIVERPQPLPAGPRARRSREPPGSARRLRRGLRRRERGGRAHRPRPRGRADAGRALEEPDATAEALRAELVRRGARRPRRPFRRPRLASRVDPPRQPAENHQRKGAARQMSGAVGSRPARRAPPQPRPALIPTSRPPHGSRRHALELAP